ILASVAVTFGWRWMAITLAGVAFALLPLVAALMRDRPEDIGIAPYGDESGVVRRTATSAQNPIAAALRGLAFGPRSRQFWLLAGTVLSCGASTNGLIGTHLIPACTDHGIAEVTSASLLAAMAIFNFAGATGSGWLSDRIDPRLLLAVYYGTRGLSLVYLP